MEGLKERLSAVWLRLAAMVIYGRVYVCEAIDNNPGNSATSHCPTIKLAGLPFTQLFPY